MTRQRSAAKVRRQMRRHRVTRMMRALADGYFWLPCPRCGEYSGGHEWKGRFCIVTEQRYDAEGRLSGEMRRGVCPACEAEMGEMGAQLCQETGEHDWVEIWSSRGSHYLGGGRHEISVSCDGPPSSVYCKNCGRDR